MMAHQNVSKNIAIDTREHFSNLGGIRVTAKGKTPCLITRSKSKNLEYVLQRILTRKFSTILFQNEECPWNLFRRFQLEELSRGDYADLI